MRNRNNYLLLIFSIFLQFGFGQDNYVKRSILLPFAEKAQEYMVRKEGHYFILNDDIIADSDFPKTLSYGRSNKDFKWPNAEIPVKIDKSIVDQGMLPMVYRALNTINKQLELSIVKYTNQSAYVVIEFSSSILGAGESEIGMQRTQPQHLLLAKSATEGTVMHEMLHAAGMYHEQCRSDRDIFVKINFDNLKEGTKHNFQIEPAGVAQGNYDYCSIMHYNSTAFSKNGLATIECLSDGKTKACPPCMGQRAGFSDQDITGIDQFYFEVNRAPSNYEFEIINKETLPPPFVYVPPPAEKYKEGQFPNLLSDSISSIAAVSRRPNIMDNWWIGKDGTVQAAFWYEGGKWTRHQLGRIGEGAPNGGIAAVSRAPNTIEIWWVGSNGSIQGAYWYEGQQWTQYELAPAGSAATSSPITAASRLKGTLELWWISPNGSVKGAFWYEGQRWVQYELAPANSASVKGGLTVVSRTPNTFELWWVGSNGSVQGAYWYEGQRWVQYELAPAGSASLNGSISAVSRMPNTLEIWWIGSNGSVQGAYWYEGQKWYRYELAPEGSASLEGGIKAVSRIKNSLELWYVGAYGSVQGKYWYEGGRWTSYEIAPAGSAARRSKIAALSRIPGSLELWWMGTDGSIQSGFWYEKDSWKRYQLAAP